VFTMENWSARRRLDQDGATDRGARPRARARRAATRASCPAASSTPTAPRRARHRGPSSARETCAGSKKRGRCTHDRSGRHAPRQKRRERAWHAHGPAAQAQVDELAPRLAAHSLVIADGLRLATQLELACQRAAENRNARAGRHLPSQKQNNDNCHGGGGRRVVVLGAAPLLGDAVMRSPLRISAHRP
jgi:hypothetical protein